MEKRRPHCPLARGHALIGRGQVRATLSALGGGVALTQTDFFKSMTTYADHTIWQDPYRPRTRVGDVYLKLSVIDDALIVSFKEL
jgi:motility quorum-sensing regulator / GCU-specific mRNA interferase toxin